LSSTEKPGARSFWVSLWTRRSAACGVVGRPCSSYCTPSWRIFQITTLRRRPSPRSPCCVRAGAGAAETLAGRSCFWSGPPPAPIDRAHAAGRRFLSRTGFGHDLLCRQHTDAGDLDQPDHGAARLAHGAGRQQGQLVHLTVDQLQLRQVLLQQQPLHLADRARQSIGQFRRIGFALAQGRQDAQSAAAEQVGDDAGELDPGLFQQALRLMLNLDPLARQLRAPPRTFIGSRACSGPNSVTASTDPERYRPRPPTPFNNTPHNSTRLS
jgi:hypothetical protein